MHSRFSPASTVLPSPSTGSKGPHSKSSTPTPIDPPDFSPVAELSSSIHPTNGHGRKRIHASLGAVKGALHKVQEQARTQRQRFSKGWRTHRKQTLDTAVASSSHNIQHNRNSSGSFSALSGRAEKKRLKRGSAGVSHNLQSDGSPNVLAVDTHYTAGNSEIYVSGRNTSTASETLLLSNVDPVLQKANQHHGQGIPTEPTEPTEPTSQDSHAFSYEKLLPSSVSSSGAREGNDAHGAPGSCSNGGVMRDDQHSCLDFSEEVNPQPASLTHGQNTLSAEGFNQYYHDGTYDNGNAGESRGIDGGSNHGFAFGIGDPNGGFGQDENNGDGNGEGGDVESHVGDKPVCYWPGCQSQDKSWRTHLRRKHIRGLLCPIPGCEKDRGDKADMKRHLTSAHRNIDSDAISEGLFKHRFDNKLKYCLHGLLGPPKLPFTPQNRTDMCAAVDAMKYDDLRNAVRQSPSAIDRLNRLSMEWNDQQRYDLLGMKMDPPMESRLHFSSRYSNGIALKNEFLQLGVTELQANAAAAVFLEFLFLAEAVDTRDPKDVKHNLDVIVKLVSDRFARTDISDNALLKENNESVPLAQEWGVPLQDSGIGSTYGPTTDASVPDQNSCPPGDPNAPDGNLSQCDPGPSSNQNIVPSSSFGHEFPDFNMLNTASEENIHYAGIPHPQTGSMGSNLWL